MEFSNIHPRFAAAASAFLDEECFEENFRQWVSVQGLRGDEANDAMVDHLWNWFDGLSKEEFQELYGNESETIIDCGCEKRIRALS